MKCPNCQCEVIDDGSEPDEQELYARMHPGDEPFGIEVRPARRRYLMEHDLGDGPD